MNDPYIVRAINPAGEALFMAQSGLSADRAEAFVYNNPAAAHYAAHSLRWGDPHAFWNSERRSAALARERMKNWVVKAEPLGEPA